MYIFYPALEKFYNNFKLLLNPCFKEIVKVFDVWSFLLRKQDESNSSLKTQNKYEIYSPWGV